jgi:hypothetical protein
MVQLDARDRPRVAVCRRLLGGMIPEPTGTTGVATNPGYAKLFAELGAGSLVVGIALVVNTERWREQAATSETLNS